MSETLVKITRGADDPLVMRISIGGWIGEELYCVYRLGPEGGNREDVIEMVKIILAALENAPRATLVEATGGLKDMASEIKRLEK